MDFGRVKRTGPTKSGMNITRKATFVRIKQNPISVTIFGASHNGSSSTKPFHYNTRQDVSPLHMFSMDAYVVLEDIVRNKGFVDARVLVGPQMDKGLLRHALVCSLL
jgi:hypothetical protein